MEGREELVLHIGPIISDPDKGGIFFETISVGAWLIILYITPEGQMCIYNGQSKKRRRLYPDTMCQRDMGKLFYL